MTQYDRLKLAEILLDDASLARKLDQICEHIDSRDNYQPTNEVRELLAKMLEFRELKDWGDLEGRVRAALAPPKRLPQPTAGEGQVRP